MEIQTHYFGTVTYSDKDLIHFQDGLFGFPDSENYLPIAFHEDADSLICLQSIDEPSVSFILMNPFLLLPDYHPVMSQEDRALLNADRDEDISYYIICVMRENPDDCTVNLKCPIAVNTTNRQAHQVILDNEIYTFRHLLKDLTRSKEE